jgi:hypothetical protein
MPNTQQAASRETTVFRSPQAEKPRLERLRNRSSSSRKFWALEWRLRGLLIDIPIRAVGGHRIFYGWVGTLGIDWHHKFGGAVRIPAFNNSDTEFFPAIRAVFHTQTQLWESEKLL